MSSPTQEQISQKIASFLETADLDAVGVKAIKAALKDELGAKAGTHYEKEWLGEEVTRLLGELQARRSGAEAAAAADGEPEDVAADDEADEEEAAAAEDDETPIDPTLGPDGIKVGDVVWAKLRLSLIHM